MNAIFLTRIHNSIINALHYNGGLHGVCALGRSIMKLLQVELIKLEGMAMNGLIKSVELVECSEPPGWMEIRAKTLEGKLYGTGCMEPEAAKRNYTVIKLYVKNWGKLINEESGR